MVGCSKVSQGCKHCYAERMAKRLVAMAKAARERGDAPGRAANYEKVLTAQGGWNGHVYLDRSALREPHTWRQPRMVFVNSMSDPFHENVPLDFIQEMFAVMNACRMHTFQVLTKRPERAAAISKKLKWTPNIWIGTSVESEDVLERVDHLRAVGSHIRFLSCEPLLGPLSSLDLTGINWVIVGGESGPGARPIEADWVREIQRRCRDEAVPFFFKQWGGVNKKKAGRMLDGRSYGDMPRVAA
jgi:protein gp37